MTAIICERHAMSWDPDSKASDNDLPMNKDSAYEALLTETMLAKEKFQSEFTDEQRSRAFAVKHWLSLLAQAKSQNFASRVAIYSEAVLRLPRSYKLWYNYLSECVAWAVEMSPVSKIYTFVNDLFENCLIHLSKMPRIWVDYLTFLLKQPLLTHTRRRFDRALQLLPVTQHHKIWPLYLSFVETHSIPSVCISVYERYLMYEPSKAGAFIDVLTRLHQYDAAGVYLTKLLSNPNSQLVENKTTHQLWLQLCDLVAQHPAQITSIDLEKVLRSGLRQFTSEIARFWCALAETYILQRRPDKARDIYEEALESISTAYDFGVIFGTYAKFLESELQAQLSSENEAEVDLAMKRLEDLLSRRSILLSSVQLRRNPHNVAEWMKRIKLFESDDHKMIAAYSEALVTIDPFKAVGRLPKLWIDLANFYCKRGDLMNMRATFEKAIKSKLRSSDDLSWLWCVWIELELSQENYKTALEIARRSVGMGDASLSHEAGYHQKSMCKSVKLWSLLSDLEMSLGTSVTLKACVDKMFDLKVITTAQLLNYTHHLEEAKFMEESFKYYERGIAIFRWPYVFDIWITYLAKFVSRYGSRELERARELFEQAIHDAPPHLLKRLYLMFAKLEEEFGLSRHSLAVYSRAAEAMTNYESKYQFYSVLIIKTMEYHGAANTRKIYEKAIESLTETDASMPFGITMCLKYVNFEKSLGEIDRARAILQHCSQFCNPRTNTEFWKTWRDFEIAHGNEDLYREMLRVKRSLSVAFSHVAPTTLALAAIPEATL